jgi:hypothetical protein
VPFGGRPLQAADSHARWCRTAGIGENKPNLESLNPFKNLCQPLLKDWDKTFLLFHPSLSVPSSNHVSHTAQSAFVSSQFLRASASLLLLFAPCSSCIHHRPRPQPSHLVIPPNRLKQTEDRCVEVKAHTK